MQAPVIVFHKQNFLELFVITRPRSTCEEEGFILSPQERVEEWQRTRRGTSPDSSGVHRNRGEVSRGESQWGGGGDQEDKRSCVKGTGGHSQESVKTHTTGNEYQVVIKLYGPDQVEANEARGLSVIHSRITHYHTLSLLR